MKRYPKIRYPGEKETQGLFVDGTVYAQEKLDGGNARFTLEKNLDEQFHTEERDIVFGTRNNVYKNQKDETKQFGDCLQFVRDSVDLELFRWYDDSYGGIVIFGEYMEPHTIQDYNWDKWKGTFIGYDVWSIGSQEFLHPTDALILLKILAFQHRQFSLKFLSKNGMKVTLHSIQRENGLKTTRGVLRAALDQHLLKVLS